LIRNTCKPHFDIHRQISSPDAVSASDIVKLSMYGQILTTWSANSELHKKPRRPDPTASYEDGG